MMLAWETLLVQAQANRDVAQALRDVAQANRVVAEAMLLAMREARGSHDKPCQDDELQAWFHDAQGAAAIAQASMDSAGEHVAVVMGTSGDELGAAGRAPHRRGLVESIVVSRHPNWTLVGMAAGHLHTVYSPSG